MASYQHTPAHGATPLERGSKHGARSQRSPLERGARRAGCVRAIIISAVVAFSAFAHAAPLTATLTTPPPAESGTFKMGAAKNPAGVELTMDSRSLLWNGSRWLPAMGEFHYSRYPASEWRDELLKMKAGGISIVATYVFWIHHEEIEGEWNWTGQRSLRDFIAAARDVGLQVVVRCGPWCHGEVRNGGLPEWIVQHPDWKLRSTDEKFLGAVRGLYGQIAAQLRGQLWKDGGPVIGIQLDNEYRGPAAYLLALKTIACDAGLDVPLYTRTGWPSLTTPMPVGEIVPLFGVYAEGFWDRELTSMPGRYWAGFHFSALRTDAAIATEMLGNRAAHDDPDVTHYPYLTCEIGGGMMNSYHRRILVDPRDVEATTLIKLASGSTLPGYYMYHGGTNPDGARTTLMEAQSTLTTNYNDLPVKTYDFQAPLGEFGEIRPQYHWLRRLHAFLNDNGSDLAGMVTVLPDTRPGGRGDVATLRWAARSDGQGGFVFVNNYERGQTLPAKRGVQFSLTLARADSPTTAAPRNAALTFPAQPIDVPGDAIICWPFNRRYQEFTLVYATALPFGHVLEEETKTRTLFFAATPGVPAEFAFATDRIAKLDASATQTRDGDRIVLHNVAPGHAAFARITTKDGRTVQCVLLDEADSLALWKGSFGGRNRMVLTRGDVVFDADAARVTATAAGATTVAIFPAPQSLAVGGRKIAGEADGIFRRYPLPGVALTRTPVAFEQIRPAGPLREIKSGPIKQPVAMEPVDEDFAAAALWRVRLPAKLDLTRNPRLRFNYTGDVARVLLGDRLLTDDFYNGNPREIGLWRFAPELAGRELKLAVLPLQKNAPIFLAPSARPDFGAANAIAELRSVELIEATTVTLEAK
jgi:beta-galactosidase